MNNGRNNNSGSSGRPTNPRPGQNPFPPASNSLVRQSPTSRSQPYSSSYSNNFDRTNARYSTDRTEDEMRYSQENAGYDTPPRSPPPPSSSQQRRQPRKQEQQAGTKNWEESIYGMYGDVRTPRDPPPRPNLQQQQRRQYQQRQQQQDDDEDSYDEEVPRRPPPQPEPQRAQPRPSQSRRPSQSQRQQRNESRQNQQGDQRDQRDQRDQQQQENGDGPYRRVHINIDAGGGEGRSWTWSTDSRDRGRTNVNFGSSDGGPAFVNFGTPFMDSGFPFGGRNNNNGRLPLNMPFNMPVNLPFGL